MRSRIISAIGALVLASTALTASPAAAVTGGVADGNDHPSVGMILFYDGSDNYRYRCTATLVAQDVLLTAAHCTAGTMGKTIVTFDSVIAEEPPSNIPGFPQSATGYQQSGSFTDDRGHTWYAGTAQAHPDYSGFTDRNNWNDVGVVELDVPVTTISPSEIAQEGYLDAFIQPALNKTIFTAVGYGTEIRKPDAGPQKPTPMSYPLLRRVAESPGQKLTPQLLQTNGNFNDNKGTGGTCFGDSGGPLFEGDVIVAVTSYGNNGVCRYIDGYQRVDIEVVQDWLASFGVTS